MANRKKNVSVSFRVTPEAADVIHQKATESGLTLSEYLTGCALGKEIVNLTELAAFTKEHRNGILVPAVLVLGAASVHQTE